MPNFCTTTDVSMIYEDFGSLTGTLGTTIIASASDWVQATLLDFYGSVFYESGTVYPYWIKKATALESIYMAFSRRMDQGQTTSTGFWEKYHTEALQILKDLKDGNHVLPTQDTAEWERGITPAIGVANGSVAAPGYGMCFSNSELPSQWYAGDWNQTFVVELDGTGSMISQQTFRWKFKYGSVWEDTKQELTWGWKELSLGAAVRFVDSGTFVNGQQWEIACTSNQGRVGNGANAKSFSLTMTR